jgi:hypothetical protein
VLRIVLLAVLGSSMPAAAPITLSWSDAHGLVPFDSDVKREMDAILSDAGFSTRWVEGGEREDVTVVMSPSDPSGPGWNLEPSSLGVYLLGADSRAVFVFHQRVLAVLGLSRSSGLLPPAERKVLSRALARVAVHEIVHRIAPALPHAEDGIMRSRLDRALLTRERAMLDQVSIAGILERLVHRAASE